MALQFLTALATVLVGSLSPGQLSPHPLGAPRKFPQGILYVHLLCGLRYTSAPAEELTLELSRLSKVKSRFCSPRLLSRCPWVIFWLSDGWSSSSVGRNVSYPWSLLQYSPISGQNVNPPSPHSAELPRICFEHKHFSGSLQTFPPSNNECIQGSYSALFLEQHILLCCLLCCILSCHEAPSPCSRTWYTVYTVSGLLMTWKGHGSSQPVTRGWMQNPCQFYSHCFIHMDYFYFA